MEDIEELVESKPSSDIELNERRVCKGKINELKYFAKRDIQQKAKIWWLTEGDKNNRFYHNAIKKQEKQNAWSADQLGVEHRTSRD